MGLTCSHLNQTLRTKQDRLRRSHCLRLGSWDAISSQSCLRSLSKRAHRWRVLISWIKIGLDFFSKREKS
ncbi:hypothetical protein GYMLUDRAFT_504870 [Collybiopsis luxurians FD-317 M1]|uniref:Uncharacterized protein n=1 Tax=Collybiopsis luxurians FD-317 M1 TaxID=944289 RepID=A0A0D0D0N9_9AGAR|nr:hypothetical protein GYMLUDRAFT_504870 [Collybiopsis luxurians FD-317 M1]